MKRINYYAAPQSSKMSKWVGIGLGGLFSVIAVGSAVIILQLTRSNAPVPVAAAAAATAPKSDDTPAPAAPAQPVQVAAAEPAQPVAAAEEPAAEEKPGKKSKHDRHHGKSSKRSSKKAPTAVAKRSGGVSDAKAHAILAKHDSRGKRSDKDALDKLLGL